MELSEDHINNILKSYKNKREREKARYEEIKDTEEFKISNRQKAKKHYDNNKDNYKQKYQEKKELNQAKSSYYYYKRNNNLEKFKEKYPERYDLLLNINYFKD